MHSYNACLSKFTNCILIPQRYMLAIMVSLSILNAYTMRVCLSMTITQMVVKKNYTKSTTTQSMCPSDTTFKEFEIRKETTYDWNEHKQGLILSSFYWGYFVTHIPGGLLAEKLGGKHVLGIGMLINAILTLLFPCIVKGSNGNWVIAVVLRVIMGLGQGAIYPTAAVLLAQWVPVQERAGASSVSFAGALIGTVISNLISGVLMTHFEGWEVVFYFFGSWGLIWNIFWQLVCYSYPRTNPCLKPKEKEFLEQELNEVSEDKPPTPWKGILTSLPVWALVLGQFGHDWGWYTMVSDLPKYMDSVLRFHVQTNGLWSALPYLLMWGATVGGGYLVDFIIIKKYLSVANTRRICATLGTILPGIFMVAASYVGCNKLAAVMMFTLTLFWMGFSYLGLKVNSIDLSPNFAGTVMALNNGLGVFAGMAAPAVVGILAPNQTMNEWRLVFWVSFGVLGATNILFVIFMSGKVQKWNNLNDDANKD
ncbi:sialin-like [Tribolium madens]|uniref:sialin-like n=1 Tax=Tribolium madens TaxID=41895 RepID=UPI001CF7674E|nr:sialin-like [Tribolium madens]